MPNRPGDGVAGNPCLPHPAHLLTTRADSAAAYQDAAVHYARSLTAVDHHGQTGIAAA